MSLGISAYQAPAYTINTPVYEGPLDLLLQLIERAELDITRLALAQVTDQYLTHLHSLEERAPEEVSAFLVIAARLVQIKSEALLPRPPQRESEEEDPGEALLRQLRIYKRFKELAGHLGERDQRGWRAYLRLAPPPKVEGRLDLSDIGLPELVEAAERVFRQAQVQTALNTVVTAPKITIREKIRRIADTLRRMGHATFRSLLGENRSRVEVVVTFLAMLELVKQRFVNASQDGLFGEIELSPADTWDENAEIELEFGE
ncbi:MAG: ScpA family protein [Anaerolineales bacterium]